MNPIPVMSFPPGVGKITPVKKVVSPSHEIENSDHLSSLLKDYPYYFLNKGCICTDIKIKGAPTGHLILYHTFRLGLKVTKKRVKKRLMVNGTSYHHYHDERIADEITEIIKYHALRIFNEGGTMFTMELGGQCLPSLKLTPDSFANCCDCGEDDCRHCPKTECRSFTRFELLIRKFIHRFIDEVDFILDEYRHPPPDECPVCKDSRDEVEGWFCNTESGTCCGHHMCYDCADKIIKTTAGPGKCPLCRSDLPYSLS